MIISFDYVIATSDSMVISYDSEKTHELKCF